jgi:hypothetical protein
MGSGRAWLGDQLFREALTEMREFLEREERQIQLILIGKDDGGLLAIYKYSSGELWECDGFAAIGSGEIVAEAMLYQRRIQETDSFQEVAYAVYEAKRLGEITPGVGPRTSMCVLDIVDGESQLRSRHVPDKGLLFLESQLARFAPQQYEVRELPKDYLCMADQFGIVSEEVKSGPQPTTPDLSSPKPSQESPGGSDES